MVSPRGGTQEVKFRARPADQNGMDSGDDLIARELMLSRFNRLMRELQRGGISRNNFQPWELNLLHDIETCDLTPRKLRSVLASYQKAVVRQLENGPGPPMMLSQFLQERSTRRPATV